MTTSSWSVEDWATKLVLSDGACLPLTDVEAVVARLSSFELPTTLGMLRSISRACEQNERYALARSYCEQAAGLEPDPQGKARLHLFAGAYMERAHDFAAAREAYAAAFTLPQEPGPTWYFLHNNLAFCLSQLGRHAEAEPLCRAAVEMAPCLPNAHKNLGVALEGLGRYPEAAHAYTAAVRACPEDPRAIRHLAALLAAHPEVAAQTSGLMEEARSLHLQATAESYARRVSARTNSPRGTPTPLPCN